MDSNSFFSIRQQDFIKLLEELLKEKRNKIDFNTSQLKYIVPYNNLYDKCLLGFEISHAKKTHKEEAFSFKVINNGKKQIQASLHLKSCIEKLVLLYGKEEVANVLKDM